MTMNLNIKNPIAMAKIFLALTLFFLVITQIIYGSISLIILFVALWYGLTGWVENKRTKII